MKREAIGVGFFIMIGLALVGCSGATPVPTPMPTSTPTKTPTPVPSPTPTSQPIELTVVHTNDTWGYSEPCG